MNRTFPIPSHHIIYDIVIAILSLVGETKGPIVSDR